MSTVRPMKHAVLVALVAALYLAMAQPCPAAGSCSAFESTRWTEADGMLRGCMASLGCGAADTSQADVFMRCDCR